MGAPKQKWTREEEEALRAGVAKHGAGKWRTILKDPEFSVALRLRSNVDLKDKWRNVTVTANGWGSREKARLALKKNQKTMKDNGSPVTPNSVLRSDKVVDAQPLAVFGGTLQIISSKKRLTSLDDLILEAIIKLREPGGSSRATIAMHIEDHHSALPEFKKELSERLKHLVTNGKLVKVNRKYRIPVDLISSGTRKSSQPLPLEGTRKVLPKKEKDDFKIPSRPQIESSQPLPLDGRQKLSPKREKNDIKISSRPQVDIDTSKKRKITLEKAAAVAAQLVARAEAAIMEAEKAAREAELAETDAEVAQAFAEAAMKALKSRTSRTWSSSLLLAVYIMVCVV
ncbi:Linker histone H1/H5, domain H15 [Dillenia turbinata]|uniref:MYB transcription factor n=1 Tax=Dillenia turbinata TaxID=194707 RepID=A0AAN8UZY4_9MAGN